MPKTILDLEPVSVLQGVLTGSQRGDEHTRCAATCVETEWCSCTGGREITKPCTGPQIAIVKVLSHGDGHVS